MDSPEEANLLVLQLIDLYRVETQVDYTGYQEYERDQLSVPEEHKVGLSLKNLSVYDPLEELGLAIDPQSKHSISFFIVFRQGCYVGGTSIQVLACGLLIDPLKLLEVHMVLIDVLLLSQLLEVDLLLFDMVAGEVPQFSDTEGFSLNRELSLPPDLVALLDGRSRGCQVDDFSRFVEVLLAQLLEVEVIRLVDAKCQIQL